MTMSTRLPRASTTDVDGRATPPLIGRHVQATYRDDPNPHFADQPLILALPRVREEQHVVSGLYERPEVIDDLTQFSRAERIDRAFTALNAFRWPIPPVLAVERHVSRLLRAGYRGRDPFRLAERQRVLPARQYDPDDQTARYADNEKIGPGGLLISGMGGTGKSTTIEDILVKLYPQVIYHRAFRGRPLILKQLVWLRVVCPQNRTVAQLCRDFLWQADYAVQPRKSFVKTYVGRRTTEGDLMDAMECVGGVTKLGVLVVDEIQNVVFSRGQGDLRILNFLVNLANKLSVPVVLVGTPEVAPIIQKAWRLERRYTALGEVWFNPMETAGKTWRQFCAAMLDHQYVSHHAEATPALLDALHDASHGVIALAVAVFFLAQERALRRGEESLDVNTIKRIAKQMRTMEPHLTALAAKEGWKLRDVVDLVAERPRDGRHGTSNDQPSTLLTKPAANAPSGRSVSAPIGADPDSACAPPSEVASSATKAEPVRRTRRAAGESRGQRETQKEHAARIRRETQSRYEELRNDGDLGTPGHHPGASTPDQT